MKSNIFSHSCSSLRSKLKNRVAEGGGLNEVSDR
jgi:hypothetical protein